MQQRRDTAANWTSNNPTLAAGELGLETDTGALKIGTGSTAWTALAYASSGTVTSVTVGTGLSGGTITNSGTIAINTAVTADLTTAQTLTNKTLTSPILVTPALGTPASGVLTNVTELPISTGVSGLGTGVATFLATPTSANLAGALTDETGTGALVFGTSPTINSPIIDEPILNAPQERAVITATSATGTVQFDTKTSGVIYYTSNASGNFTLNVRGDSETTLNSLLVTGDAITVVFLNTNGATPYYASAFTVDGGAITPKFQNGVAFAAGNASSIDIYTYTIIKTANATFTVLAGQTKFA
jgi:hypothetical protein